MSGLQARQRKFASHSQTDQESVKWLVGVLRRCKLPVWYGDTEIQGAQQVVTSGRSKQSEKSCERKRWGGKPHSGRRMVC